MNPALCEPSWPSLLCLKLFVGCGEKKESRSANETQAAKKLKLLETRTAPEEDCGVCGGLASTDHQGWQPADLLPAAN